MKKSRTFKTLCIAATSLTFSLCADDLSAFEQFRLVRSLDMDAQEQIVAGDHKDAAKIFLRIVSLETRRDRKAAYLLKAANEFFLADKGNDALEHYKNLLQNYSLYTPYDEVVTKLRALAEKFVEGEATFLGLKDVPAAIKVYEVIIREAPASHISQKDRFRLAELLKQEDRLEEAVAVYQAIVKNHSRNWDARAELAILIGNLAKVADGDGSKTRTAIREANLVLSYAPNHPKAGKLRQLIASSHDLNAQRLLEQAEFYLIKAHKRPSAARRYLHDVITQFPNSTSAQKARNYLKTHPDLVKLERQMAGNHNNKPAQQPPKAVPHTPKHKHDAKHQKTTPAKPVEPKKVPAAKPAEPKKAPAAKPDEPKKAPATKQIGPKKAPAAKPDGPKKAPAAKPVEPKKAPAAKPVEPKKVPAFRPLDNVPKDNKPAFDSSTFSQTQKSKFPTFDRRSLSQPAKTSDLKPGSYSTPAKESKLQPSPFNKPTLKANY